jgi:hypothetical protein
VARRGHHQTIVGPTNATGSSRAGFAESAGLLKLAGLVQRRGPHASRRHLLLIGAERKMSTKRKENESNDALESNESTKPKEK